MTLDPILRALADGPAEVSDVTALRGNEVTCGVHASRVKDLGELVCGVLGAELIAILAEDRRRQAGAFFVHYVFAHTAENWFVHAATRLDGTYPRLSSLAPFVYPASRFERELRDLFGIQ